MDDAEKQAREKLAQCSRSLNMLGLIGMAGHISLRIPDSPNILITPGGGLNKAKYTMADMVVMDAEGKLLAGSHPLGSEVALHTAIHAARPDVTAVGHFHLHWANVFGCVDRPLDIVLKNGSRLRGRIARYKDPRLVETPENGAKLAAALGSAMAVLMRGHGATVVGETIEEMFYLTIALEDNARTLWEACMLGKPEVLTDEDLARRDGDPPAVSWDGFVFDYYAGLEAASGEQTHRRDTRL